MGSILLSDCAAVLYDYLKASSPIYSNLHTIRLEAWDVINDGAASILCTVDRNAKESLGTKEQYQSDYLREGYLNR